MVTHVVYFRWQGSKPVPSKVTDETALPGELLTPTEFYQLYGQPHRYTKLFVLVDVRKNDTTIVNQHRFYDPLHEQLKEVNI